MLTRYVVTLGAHSDDPTAKQCWQNKSFDGADMNNVVKILRLRGFPGATIVKGHGMWLGQLEEAFIITILTDKYLKVKAFANQLRPSFKQNSIMICSTGTGEFLAKKMKSTV